MDLCSKGDIQALLGRHGFRFSKGMGQNFLIDPALPVAIAQAAGIPPGGGVLEIGPGIGALTAAMAPYAEKVVAVELDRRLLAILEETLAPFSNVTVVPGDILKIDLPGLLAQQFGPRPVQVCANLPYNITTPVLTRLTETAAVEAITVMIQREVARRLCAPPGTAAAGAFSLYLHYHMEVSPCFDVPREAFLPPPKVLSAVITCRRRRAPVVAVEDEAFFFRLIRGAFALRRKTLVNALSVAMPEADKAALAQAIADCGLSPAVRGEALSLEDFATLSRHLSPRAAGR